MNKDRLGYYLVGWKKFYNKPLALMESKKTGYDLLWAFNDKVYDSIDWAVDIQTPLAELYRLRALQLRQNYDFLSLQFSGGADSNNILHAFIDNNIFLDEIVMQLPEPARKNFNNTDLSSDNVNSELEFAAKPRLEKYCNLLHPLTKIRYQDYAKTAMDIFSNDNWFDLNPAGTNLAITGICRQKIIFTDPVILEKVNKGKVVAIIQGVDKPLVYFNGDNYFAFFSDLSAMHNSPHDASELELFTDFCKTEFFYWTPSFPEIVVKQAQEIKKHAELNPHIKEALKLTLKKHIVNFKSILHPIIYPPHTEPEFQTDKPINRVFRGMDRWFWDTASTAQKGNYLAGIEYIGQNVKDSSLINSKIYDGFSATNSKFYKI